jgi:uncharacterized protein with FMN-binding domain
VTVDGPGGGRAAGRGGRVALAAAVAVLLALAVLAAGTAGPAPRDPGQPLVPVVPAATGTPSPAPADDDAQTDTEAARSTQLQVEVPVQDLVVVAVLVVGALVALLLRRRRPRREETPAVARAGLRAGPAAGADARPLLDRALAAAEHELAPGAHREPRDAVIACWLRLEEGAAAAGVRRRPAQTPTEFTTALIGGLLPGAAEHAALDELRALYSRARFGSAPLDADAPARAAAALGAVRAGLIAAGPVPPQLAGGAARGGAG